MRTLLSSSVWLLLWLWLAATVAPAEDAPAEDAPRFLRGLNLNGPPVTIDGNEWDGKEAESYVCSDSSFENQSIPLLPPTDSDRAKMIRSSRYGGNRVELHDVPAGKVTLFVFVWEDNRAENFSVAVNGRTVLQRYDSGAAGHWEKLGPWPATVGADRKLVVTSQGGTANFSGIEVWTGDYDGYGSPSSEVELAFFEKRIRPLLIEKCYECHSAEGAEIEGELLVDSRATLRRGGSSGPAVIPGDVEHSLLIEAVRYENDALQMPPEERLSDSEIADLEQWIKNGAADPRSTATKHRGKQLDIEAAREFWSLKPIGNPVLPVVKLSAWPRSDIDTFVLAKQEQHGLAPAIDADKRVLLRRATYDLIGLPPTPAEMSDFLADNSEEAFPRVVERLLASPRHGERWGRYWLDIVRYADTAGDNSDYPIPQIHRYRDWVIAAFNRDLPYDDFVRDQLAGDLRGGETDTERDERTIATGYLANARRFGSRVDDYPQHLTIEDTIDNLGRCFLGMSLSCARCHDHKFDPITARDYYGIYGIFHSTRYPWPGIELDKQQRNFVPLVARDRMAEMERLLTERTKEQARLTGRVKKLKEELKKASDEQQSPLELELQEAERLAEEFSRQPPLFETAYAVAEADTREDVAVQLKGDPAHPGDVVPRSFLTVLGGEQLPENAQVSGRAELAEWILADNNPLTARVMANRIWQYHFGVGLVPTPNDFGHQGKPVSHPELLDYLATQFRQGDWSIKAMHRLIMHSRTYQQASLRESQAIEADPTNQWLSAYPRRRLDAESIRDTLLVIGANLDCSPAGPHPFPPQHEWGFTQHKPFKEVYESHHRSVYLMTQRIQRHPFLAVFDGADPSTSTAARMTSTTPLQALYLLNDALVHEQSRGVAKRVVEHASQVEQRIAFAYELLLSRPPQVAERTAAAEFLAQARKLLQGNGEGADQIDIEAWQALIRSLFLLNEFIYLD